MLSPFQQLTFNKTSIKKSASSLKTIDTFALSTVHSIFNLSAKATFIKQQKEKIKLSVEN